MSAQSIAPPQPGQGPPAPPPLTPAEIENKAVTLACLKTFGKLMSTTLLKNCICTSALVAKIMRHYKFSYRVVVGYYHLPGVAVSFPHMWVETGPGDVTDLTWSSQDRMIVVLGQGFGFAEGAVKPTYTRTATFNVYQGALSVEALQDQAVDLERYLAGAPPGIQTRVLETFEVAINGDDKVDISVSKDLLTKSRPGP